MRRKIVSNNPGIRAFRFIHIDERVEGVLKMMGSTNYGGAVNLSTKNYKNFIDLARIAARTFEYYPHVHGVSGKPEGALADAADMTTPLSLAYCAAISL